MSEFDGSLRVRARLLDPGDRLLGLMIGDIKRDAEVLRAKRRIITVLRQLPSDLERRRVLLAVLALTGALDMARVDG